MTPDRAALLAALADGAGPYDAHVRSGNVRELLAVLAQPDPARVTIWLDRPRGDVVRVLAPAIRAVTDPAQLDHLRLLLDDPGAASLPLSDPGYRGELIGLLNQAGQDALTALASRHRTRAEAFKYAAITREHVFDVLRDIPHSALAQYLANPPVPIRDAVRDPDATGYDVAQDPELDEAHAEYIGRGVGDPDRHTMRDAAIRKRVAHGLPLPAGVTPADLGL